MDMKRSPFYPNGSLIKRICALPVERVVTELLTSTTTLNLQNPRKNANAWVVRKCLCLSLPTVGPNQSQTARSFVALDMRQANFEDLSFSGPGFPSYNAYQT